MGKTFDILMRRKGDSAEVRCKAFAERFGRFDLPGQ
jgi:hypothetical protein